MLNHVTPGSPTSLAGYLRQAERTRPCCGPRADAALVGRGGRKGTKFPWLFNHFPVIGTVNGNQMEVKWSLNQLISIGNPQDRKWEYV